MTVRKRARNVAARPKAAGPGVARIVRSGRSQAVRLPPEFRFETNQVAVRREGSNLVLSPLYEDWDDYLRNAPRATEDLHEAVADIRRDPTRVETREPLE